MKRGGVYAGGMPEPLPDLNEIPTYGLPEASAYLHLPYTVVRSWTREEGLIRSGERNLLSYANLLELHVLKALRKEYGLPMPGIRRALARYGRQYGTAHPLLDPRLETDGFSLILHEGGSYENLSRHGQLGFPSVLQRYVRRIERRPQQTNFYPFVLPQSDSDEEPRSVLISPMVAFGRPVLNGTGITTEVIAGRFMARDSLVDLAEEYGVSTAQIEEAIRWESPKLKHAA